MNFDKTAYRTSKDRVIQLIKASHDWENTEGFIADGVIDPDVYALQHLRVLCVLAESYGYDDCGMTDIEDQPHSDLMGVGNPEVKTPRRMAALDPEEAFSHSQRNKSILQEQITTTAPHLMLVCGRDAFASLLRLGLLGSETSEGKLWQLQCMPVDTRLMQVSHPAYFPDWGSYEAIYRNYERLHEQW